jgi:hypothetical protein
MAPKKMNRAGQPRPVPNAKQGAKGGRTSSRKGVPNGSTRKPPPKK